MITQHVLLVEMLFLSSVLMIIIVTGLAQEAVSQDSYPWAIAQYRSPWLILCQIISGCMPWERLSWNCYNLEVFFLSILSSPLRNKAPLKLERQAHFCLHQWLCWKLSPANCHRYCNKLYRTKCWMTGPVSSGPGLNPCLWRPRSCTC